MPRDQSKRSSQHRNKEKIIDLRGVERPLRADVVDLRAIKQRQSNQKKVTKDILPVFVPPDTTEEDAMQHLSDIDSEVLQNLDLDSVDDLPQYEEALKHDVYNQEAVTAQPVVQTASTESTQASNTGGIDNESLDREALLKELNIELANADPGILAPLPPPKSRSPKKYAPSETPLHYLDQKRRYHTRYASRDPYPVQKRKPQHNAQYATDPIAHKVPPQHLNQQHQMPPQQRHQFQSQQPQPQVQHQPQPRPHAQPQHQPQNQQSQYQPRIAQQPQPQIQPQPRTAQYTPQQHSQEQYQATIAYQQERQRRRLASQQFLDKQFASFAYGPPVISHDIPKVLKAKKKKKLLKNIFKWSFGIALLCVLVAVLYIGYLLLDLQENAGVYAKEGYQHMQQGKEALLLLDGDKAKTHFEEAYRVFYDLENSFGVLSSGIMTFANMVPFDSRFVSATQLLQAGKMYSQAGIDISLALSKTQEMQDPDNQAISPQERAQYISEIAHHFRMAYQKFTDASKIVDTIHLDVIPVELQDEFYAIQRQSTFIEDTLNEVNESMFLLLNALGYSGEKRYLLIFQNHSELRATGGFIGTYGTVNVKNGTMSDVFVNGIYDPDGQLKDKIVPPQQLKSITPTWGMRDANWFFDFPTSAQKLISLFYKTGGGTVDGVIAFTPHTIQSLLELLGDIEMPDYDVTLTSENFLEVVQLEVEENYDRELNKPKQILADMTPILIERVMEYEDKLALADILFEGLIQRNIMMYSIYPETQEVISEYGWSGEVIQQRSRTTEVNDYLAVVVSNVAGGKADIYTDSLIDVTTVVKQNGTVEKTIWISREHTGGDTDYTWYNKANKSYVRFYVPKGSRIIEAAGFSTAPNYIEPNYIEEGFLQDNDLAYIATTSRMHTQSNTDVFEESGKTVFGNWLRVEPKDKAVAFITYRLPDKVLPTTQQYNFMIQKQAGFSPYYKGLIKMDNSFATLDGCVMNETPLTIPKFDITQTHDIHLSCDILQKAV